MSPVRALQGALVAVFGAAIFLVTPACAPECIDKFDCASKAKPGELLTCENGQCVPGSPTGTGGGTGGGDMGGGTGGGGDVGGGTGGGGTGGGTGGGGGDMDAGTGGGGGDMDAGTGGGGGTDAGTGGGGGSMDAGTGGGGGSMGIAGTYVASLTNSQEVPPNTQGSSGSGTFTLSELADGGYNVAWNVTHTGIPNGQLSGGHIHTAIGGTNGAVLVSLGASLTSPIMGNADITPGQAMDLSDGRTYVNIHTTRNPGGEIRGQILKPGQYLATGVLAPVTRPDGGMVTGSGSLQALFTNPDGGPGFVPGQSVVDYEGAWSITATKASLRLDLADGGIDEFLVLTLTGGGSGAKGTAMPSPSTMDQPYVLIEDADGPALRAPMNMH